MYYNLVKEVFVYGLLRLIINTLYSMMIYNVYYRAQRKPYLHTYFLFVAKEINIS